MQRVLLGFLVLALLTGKPAPGRADDGGACELPGDLTTPDDPLPHVAAALRKGAVDILALGSGSTVGDTGTAAGAALSYHAAEGSFPYKMVDTLQALRPSVHFELAVKGGRNMTAEAMLPILHEQLASHHYDLILWQTGTVEAVRGSSPDGLRGELQEGADAVQQADADLVLIDSQFSRFLRANADLAPYETVLQQITGNPDVTLFRRFDLTQAWVGSGQIDLERVSPDERDKTIAQLNNCLGEALARYILAGASEH